MTTEQPQPRETQRIGGEILNNGQEEDLPVLEQVETPSTLRRSLNAGWEGYGRFSSLYEVAKKYQALFDAYPSADDVLIALQEDPDTCPNAYMWGYHHVGMEKYRKELKRPLAPKFQYMYALLRDWKDTPLGYAPFFELMIHSNDRSEKRNPDSISRRFGAMIGEPVTQKKERGVQKGSKTSNPTQTGTEPPNSVQRLIAGILLRAMYKEKFNLKMGRLAPVDSVVESMKPDEWLKNWVSKRSNQTHPGLLFHMGWIDGAQKAIHQEASEFTNNPEKLILMLEWIIDCDSDLFTSLSQMEYMGGRQTKVTDEQTGTGIWQVLSGITRRAVVKETKVVDLSSSDAVSTEQAAEDIVPDEGGVRSAFLHLGRFIHQQEGKRWFPEHIRRAFEEEIKIAEEEDVLVEQKKQGEEEQVQQQREAEQLAIWKRRESAQSSDLPVGTVLLEIRYDEDVVVSRVILVKGHSKQRYPSYPNHIPIVLLKHYDPIFFTQTSISVSKRYIADVLAGIESTLYVKLELTDDQRESLIVEEKPPRELPDWLQNKVLEWDNKKAPFTPITRTQLPPTPQT